MRTFPNYTPKWGLSPSTKYKILTTRFGDGYTQRGRDGINNKQESYKCTFELPFADIQRIAVFLDDHYGSEAFMWAAPNKTEAPFTCKSYSGPKQIGRAAPNHAETYYSLSLTLNRVHDI